MTTLKERLWQHISAMAVGSPIMVNGLLCLGGSRSSICKALSALVEEGRLIRAERGIYFARISGRFGWGYAAY